MSPRAQDRSGGLFLNRSVRTFMRAFWGVFVIGFLISFTARHVYRSTVKIMVEDYPGAAVSFGADNPLSHAFSSPSTQSVANQFELIQGDRVLTTTFNDADVPVGSCHLTFNRIPGTGVIEISVESVTPTYAERMAATLPNSYLMYITGNRKVELENAYQFARIQLQEEQAHLTDFKNVKKKLIASGNADEDKLQMADMDIRIREESVLQMKKSVEQLRLSGKIMRDPVLVINAASKAVQIAPNRGRIMLTSCLAGSTLGLILVLLPFLTRRTKGD